MSTSLPLADASVAERENWIIDQALTLLDQRLFQRDPALQNPLDVRRYLKLKLAGEVNEVFAVVFLVNQHRTIAFEPLFTGTVDSASVYPRVVLMRALERNAAAVILCHNHPSGQTTPSAADRALTARLREVLAHVDVRVLDHFVVGEGDPFSFAEAGLL